MARVSSSLIQVIVLALWLGAAGFLSAVVAPALFDVLPSRTLAGAVVGRVLPVVFYLGILIALAVLAMQVAAQGGWAWRGREISALVMAGACAVAQFGVAPRIAKIRSEIGGPIENLPLDDARRLAFGRLHGISVAWLGLAILAALVAMVLAARTVQADHVQ